MVSNRKTFLKESFTNFVDIYLHGYRQALGLTSQRLNLLIHSLILFMLYFGEVCIRNGYKEMLDEDYRKYNFSKENTEINFVKHLAKLDERV